MTAPPAAEYFETGSKRSGHGPAITRSDRGDVPAAEAAQPITGRGIGYKLFVGA